MTLTDKIDFTWMQIAMEIRENEIINWPQEWQEKAYESAVALCKGAGIIPDILLKMRNSEYLKETFADSRDFCAVANISYRNVDGYWPAIRAAVGNLVYRAVSLKLGK